jgi:methionyl-tRNA formyltransferase
MKITFLCSEPTHPVNAYLNSWMATHHEVHEIDLIQEKAQLTGGAILFLISCSEIVTSSDRTKYASCLVLHASDLPKGRGWNPHIWELLQGADFITLSLIEAEDKVDSGRIWKKTRVPVPKHALWDEINHLLFNAEIELIDYAVGAFAQVTPTAQTNTAEATYYPRRTPKDSEIDVHKTIAEQFDMIRVCDPNRYPAYFEYMGQRYILKLEKSNGQ